MRTTTRLPRTFARGLAALAVSGTLVLSGCSSDSDEPEAESSSDASQEASEDASEDASAEPSEDASDDASDDATDDASDAAVTYDLPEGWEDVTEEVGDQVDDQVNQQSGGSLVSAAREPVAGNRFAENVNIIQLGAAPTDDLDQIEQQSLAQLEAGGLEDAESLGREQLDGEEAIRQTGVATQGPASYRVDQFITLRDDQAWVVTFSHKTGTSDADRQADIDTVIDSIDFED